VEFRKRLVLLVVLVLLPPVALAAALASAVHRAGRADGERLLARGARDLAAAVDRELWAATTTLEALTAARSLERDDLAAFYQDARRTLSTQPTWYTVRLARPTGEPLFDLLRPFGAALEPDLDQESFHQLVQTERPVAGRLVVGPLSGIDEFAVRVPVLREGRLAYVLTAAVSPAVMARLLTEQPLPDAAIGWVLDPAGRVAARMPGEPELVGRRANPELLPPGGGPGPGSFARARGVDGLEVYSAASRSARARWTAALAVPAERFDAPLRRTAAMLAAAGAGALLLALALGALYGRRLARTVGGAPAMPARSGAGGEAPRPDPTPVQLTDVGSGAPAAPLPR
jgi:hypothetical protein